MVKSSPFSVVTRAKKSLASIGTTTVCQTVCAAGKLLLSGRTDEVNTSSHDAAQKRLYRKDDSRVTAASEEKIPAE